MQDAAYDAFRETFLARVESGKVGDPADPETEVGPLVNEKAMEDVLGAIERGRSEGGRVLAGGGRGDDDAYLVAPTVFEDVADDAMLSCEEVFGPVTSLYRFGDLDEAIARANAVEFGLSAAIFTRDLGATQQFVERARGGHPPRQLPDRGRRRPRAVRRRQGLGLRPARAGPRGARVLHRGGHRLPGRLRRGERQRGWVGNVRRGGTSRARAEGRDAGRATALPSRGVQNPRRSRAAIARGSRLSARRVTHAAWATQSTNSTTITIVRPRTSPGE